MDGKVLAIFMAPERSVPMVQVSEAFCVAGHGLQGDRYGAEAGSFSKTREAIRHVSLISVHAIDLANVGRDEPFLPADTRRNILVSTAIEALNDLVGKEFSIGTVRCRGAELCTPCNLPSKYSGKLGFKDAFDGKGGLRAEVLDDGPIAVGDRIAA